MNVKENILNNCKKLNKDDYITFLNFLREENLNYSENNNGVFINLNVLNKKNLSKINEKILDIISKKIENIN